MPSLLHLRLPPKINYIAWYLIFTVFLRTNRRWRPCESWTNETPAIIGNKQNIVTNNNEWQDGVESPDADRLRNQQERRVLVSNAPFNLHSLIATAIPIAIRPMSTQTFLSSLQPISSWMAYWWLLDGTSSQQSCVWDSNAHDSFEPIVLRGLQCWPSWLYLTPPLSVLCSGSASAKPG